MPPPAELEKLSAELSRARITATRPNGLVSVDIDGHGEILRLNIDTSRLDAAEVRLIESAVVDAINEAEDRSAALEEQLLGRIFVDE